MKAMHHIPEKPYSPKSKRPRQTVIIPIIIAAIVILSNTPPAQYFLLPSYSYENADKSFTFTEEPGGPLDFRVCQIRWERFKKQHKQNNNDKNNNEQQTLYRTFPIRPWAFWEWWQYIAHSKRFTLPYKIPKD